MASTLYIQAYTVVKTTPEGAIHVDPSSVQQYRVDPAVFRRRDTDLPEAYSHSESLRAGTRSTAASSYEAEDDATTTLVVESAPGRRHEVACSTTGQRYIQFGRAANGANDHVFTSAFMPRYAFRLVSSGAEGVTVKAAGFDPLRMLFLPAEATVLGDSDYSTSNRLFLLQGVTRSGGGDFSCDRISTVSIRGHVYDKAGRVCLNRVGHRLRAGDALMVGVTLFVVMSEPAEASNSLWSPFAETSEASETIAAGMRKIHLNSSETM